MHCVSSRSWITILILGLAPASHAALREWDGDAQMNNTWITPDNWVGNVAPNPGDDLLFQFGARHPNNNNNFPPGTTFNTIELRGGGMGSSYNISGNSIAFNAGIHVENNSGSPADHSLNNSLLLNSNQTFFVQNDVGTFSLLGPINLNGKNLTFDITTGSQAHSDGVISGPGTVIKTGSGTLHINGIQPTTPVLLAAGTLKGIGTVGTLTSVAVGGPGSAVLSPGGSPGILTSSNVVLNASATFNVELNGTTAGTTYDRLRVTARFRSATPRSRSRSASSRQSATASRSSTMTAPIPCSAHSAVCPKGQSSSLRHPRLSCASPTQAAMATTWC